MSNVFAAKESGMSSMMKSLLPQDVLDAITMAKQQLPAVIDAVQAAVKRIESKLDHIDSNLTIVMIKLHEQDPNYVPANELLPANTVNANGNVLTK